MSSQRHVFRHILMMSKLDRRNPELHSLDLHCVESVRIQKYSRPHFPVFGLYTERYGVSLRI